MSYAKQKGTAYETAVVNYFKDCGFTTPRRIVLGGASGDKGDIWLGENPTEPAVIIECKNYAKELPYKMVEDFVEEARVEYTNAKPDVSECNNYRALLLVKRPNLGIADSWIIYKNIYNITNRCRLGDVVNKENFQDIKFENDRLRQLEVLLRGTSIFTEIDKLV